MKRKIYCVVISELDEFGNREHAWEMSNDVNPSKMKKERHEYQRRINLGEFKDLGKNLIADIEVRDYETNDLIEII